MDQIKPRLYIISGLPGSGKTTLAKKIVHHISTYYHRPGPVNHYEADMFFTDENGNYKFDRSRIGEAHSWCQQMVSESLNHGYYTIVSNTFCCAWERKFYFDLARKHNVIVRYIRCRGKYKNIHDVPEDVLLNMEARFESLSEEEIQDIVILISEEKGISKW